MARTRRLNDASPQVIEENFLKQNPDPVVAGLPDEATGIVIANHITPMRRVIFINGRDPGVPLSFHHASKTHPLKQYTLLDGFEYELPVEVIDSLEERHIPEYGYRKSQQGHPEMYVMGKKYLYQFRTPPKKVA
jgi:hypothetical protein